MKSQTKMALAGISLVLLGVVVGVLVVPLAFDFRAGKAATKSLALSSPGDPAIRAEIDLLQRRQSQLEGELDTLAREAEADAERLERKRRRLIFGEASSSTADIFDSLDDVKRAGEKKVRVNEIIDELIRIEESLLELELRLIENAQRN